MLPTRVLPTQHRTIPLSVKRAKNHKGAALIFYRSQSAEGRDGNHSFTFSVYDSRRKTNATIFPVFQSTYSVKSLKNETLLFLSFSVYGAMSAKTKTPLLTTLSL